ncbi:3-ketoacyl-ACP synthase [Phytoactinopolyspora halotolerans]|uniref:3-ketoacyl-ACP synthase n=1 Tax=Phytoactinopolyspora halotolerans TaxID=1981512 RepID=A0A6L9S2X0_9ACTN|nr:3-ketoacyl-ACP synthase [Phytoactinopolyspora halotolerans]
MVGVGAVTGLGPTADDLWSGARDGRVAIGPVQGLDLTDFSTKVGAEVRDLPEAGHRYLRPGDFRDRVFELALHAADEAVAGTGAVVEAVGTERCGVVYGTCNAGLLSGREWLARLDAGRDPDPRLAAMMPPQAQAEAIAGALGWGGPVLSVNTACASGANAIGWATDLIRSGRADVVLAGGADAFSDVLYAGFHSLEALSPVPARPYSAERQGLSLGEGAAFLVLASEAVIGVQDVRAWVGGYGLSADGYHPTAPRPDGSGASRAIAQALRTSGLVPEDVGYVNGHGTGTEKNDAAETRAIRSALGEHADTVPVSSTKSVIGHLLGAAGAAEAVVTVRALEEQVVPPTASYSGADPDCDLDYVPLDPRPMRSDVAVSNNFAFGGSNASVAFVRAGSDHRPPRPQLHDVVVSGMAVLGPFGEGAEAAEAAVAEGASVPEGPDGRVATMEVDPEPYLTRKARRRMDRMTVAAIVAAAKAMNDAGLEAGSEDAKQTGVIVGTSAGPVESMARFTRGVLCDGAAGADPAVFPNTVYNQPAGQVAQHLHLHGPTSTVSVGHASGAAALLYGYELIRTGRASSIVCLAVDVIDELVVKAYDDLGLLSHRSGDGRFALADAAVAVVLESASGAAARRRRALAEVTGYGCASRVRPGGVPSDVRGSATERASRQAIETAGIEPGDVTDIWSVACGLEMVDRGERAAIDRLFPSSGGARPRLHQPKTVLGEPTGAAGTLLAALAAHDLADRAAGVALVNAVSLGGTALSVVMRSDHDTE